jgi:hypothetical protein
MSIKHYSKHSALVLELKEITPGVACIDNNAISWKTGNLVSCYIWFPNNNKHILSWQKK